MLVRTQSIATKGLLASLLGNRAIILSELGRYPEAASAISEGITILDELVRDEPRAFTSDLVTALKNARLTYSISGDHEAAAAAERRLGELRPG